MRLNNRNKQPFWYANYVRTCEIYDEYGNQNGTYAVYGEPVKAYGNISPARGSVEVRQFGDDDLYDKVIAVEDAATPIDENTVLWIGVEPETGPWTTEKLDVMTTENGVPMFFFPSLKKNDDGTLKTPWNYIVRRVARGLPVFGEALVAISKVDVS